MGEGEHLWRPVTGMCSRNKTKPVHYLSCFTVLCFARGTIVCWQLLLLEEIDPHTSTVMTLPTVVCSSVSPFLLPFSFANTCCLRFLYNFSFYNSLSPPHFIGQKWDNENAVSVYMNVCVSSSGNFSLNNFCLLFRRRAAKTLISSSFSLLFVQRRSQSEPWINRLVGHSYRAKAALTLHVWLGALCALCVTAAAVAVVVAKKGGVSASTRATRSSVGRLSADKIDSISCS